MRVERSKIHGWGVLTVKEINCEELIVEYIGEVICKPVSLQKKVVRPVLKAATEGGIWGRDARIYIVYLLQVSDRRALVYEKAGICDYFFKLDANYVV